MKKILPLKKLFEFSLSTILTLITLTSINAQTSQKLDINNIRAEFWNDGNFFWDRQSSPSFECPKDSGKHANFAAGLWISGYDDGGILRVAAQTYNQTGTDYQFGPISNSRIANDYNNRYNKVWKINKTEIEEHILNFNQPNYIIPENIQTWPGNGMVSNGEPLQLAPYIDVDGDNLYNPANGDYPNIKGDQALYYIFNDSKPHTESGSVFPFNMDIHVMAYEFYNLNQTLNHTIFIDFKFENRSLYNYSDFTLGIWDDPDLGNPYDDFIGSDAQKNIGFVYNATDVDQPNGANTYGSHPPALGIQMLSEPMEKMMYFINNSTQQGNPGTMGQYNNYLNGIWRNGMPLTYGGTGIGGTDSCNFAFCGNTDSSFSQPWEQSGTANDLRLLPVMNLGTLNLNSSICGSIAYIVSFGDSGSYSSVVKLKQDAEYVKYFYENTEIHNCFEGIPLSTKNKLSDENIQIYPNPNKGNFTINFMGEVGKVNSIELFSIDGKLQFSDYKNFKSSYLTINNIQQKGIYILKIKDINGNCTNKKVIID